MKKLQMENLCYRYGKGTPYEKLVLDGLDISFEGGCITGLIGHTGCGKSTLVQLCNGLLKPERGRVLLDGRDIFENPKEIAKVRFRVGLVFQYPEYQLFEETVRKDIAFGPTNMGLSEEEIARRVEQAARFVGISPKLLDQSPFELSGGQKRRVAIAGVIAMDPEVLILDEPAAGLDPMGREDILGGVRAYQRESGSTVIIVSHSMEDMARYADRLLVMQDGKLCMDGTPGEVFSDKEALNCIGLDIPQITRFMGLLAERGAQVNGNIYTVEGAVQELSRLLGKTGKGARKSC
jgi:energy-coupling factor transport system ATP-binding protein